MIIEPGSKQLEELVAEFWTLKLGYPFAPPKVKIYSREEYIEETGNDKTVARYSPGKEQLSLLPDIVLHSRLLLHELAHHLQSSQLGSAEFLRKYDEYTEEFGYHNNPYEVEAREFEMKWWPEFEQLLKKKLESEHHSMWLTPEQRKKLESKYGAVSVRWGEEVAAIGDLETCEKAAKAFYSKMREAVEI